jgi:anti-sigma B factor antagonist
VFSAQVVGREGAATVVRLAGELDIAAAPEVRACLLTVGDTDIIVDVAGLTFLDSSGLAPLVAAHRRAGGHGHTVALRNPPSRVAYVLRVSGVDQVLKVES